LIFKEITNIQTPFILIGFLRIAKYVEFKEKDKILVIQFLEMHLRNTPFDFENLIQNTVAEMDQLIIYTNPEHLPKPQQKKKELPNKNKRNEDDDDLFEFPNISMIKKEQNSAKKQKESPKKKKENEKTNDMPESPKFNFKGTFEKN